MHFPSEAGRGWIHSRWNHPRWIHLAHKRADMLLLMSIASLALLPLVYIYIMEMEKYEKCALLASSEVIRTCVRGLVYMAFIFPCLLTPLSVYVSIQLIRGEGLDETNTATSDDTTFPYDSPKIPSHSDTMFWLLYKNTKVLKTEDKVVATEQEGPASTALTRNTDNHCNWWKIPCSGLPETLSSSSSSSSHDSSTEDEEEDIDHSVQECRLVTEGCAICMHPYQTGERLVWSSNPNCIHCYHYSCLQAWMEPWDARTRRCPCCRQSFVIQ